jgi:hypothetical protein
MNKDTQDLQKALASFLICFGAGMPDELKSSIRSRCEALADQIEYGGEPNVGKLLRGLAQAFDSQIPPMPE